MVGNFLEPTFYISITAVLIVLISTILIIFKDKTPDKIKKPLFLLMIIPVILSTLYLGGHTIYKNINSETKGPVHWHADYEVWVCGEQKELIDPKFPSNKIGTPLFHEHNDDRIHVEGTVKIVQSVDIDSYFKTVGGMLSQDSISYKTNNGLETYSNGDNCQGKPATLKVYVNGKLNENFLDYVLYPSSYVPPGDCIIIVFDESNSPTTSKICSSWSVKEWNYESFQRETVEIGGRTWQ